MSWFRARDIYAVSSLHRPIFVIAFHSGSKVSATVRRREMHRFKTHTLVLLALSAMATLMGTHGCPGETVLVGRAVLPAETFRPGPTSGERLGTAAINGVFPPFVNKQP